MSKPAAVLAKSADPLDEARAELARRRQHRDAELAQFGGPKDGDLSPRGRHLRKRFEVHAARVRQAEATVTRLQVAAALDEAKATAQAGIDDAAIELKARQGDVQREAAALAEVAGRAVALNGQIAQLEASRFAGLEVAQAALAECARAGDRAGSAGAAEEVARIEAEATSIVGLLRPLQLQLAEVAKLKAAAEARLQEARSEADEAAQLLARAHIEALAIARDEAAIAFRDAHVAFQAADTRPSREKRNLPVEFTIGASSRVLAALGSGSHEVIPVTGLTLQRARQSLEASDEAGDSIFDVDPLTLEPAAVVVVPPKPVYANAAEQREAERLASYAREEAAIRASAHGRVLHA